MNIFKDTLKNSAIKKMDVNSSYFLPFAKQNICLSFSEASVLKSEITDSQSSEFSVNSLVSDSGINVVFYFSEDFKN